jgi:predicted SAM-dependent methyltransferase/glycosyltransferase involved in cell wall biosynthesis
MRPTISLAIIMRDVSKTLDRCLQGFSQCADEIVIVDTGSVDNSVEIAKKYTDKIFHFKWIDDFSAARNFSFSKCTCDWIQWCDADDYIMTEDIRRIKELDLTDWDMVVMDYVYARDEYGNDKSVVPRERLIRRSMGLKWEKEIHECILLQGRVKRTDIRTYHDKQHGTSERNLAILERITENDPCSRNLYYLGKEYFDHDRIDLATQFLNRFLDCPDAFWENVYQGHCKLAKCYYQKGDEEQFKHHIFQSIKMEDRQAEPFYFLGLYYMNKKQWRRAIQWYEMCVRMKHPEDLLGSYMPEYYTWLPNLNLCLCYNAIGDIEKAYACNEEVLKLRPKDERVLNNKRILADAIKRKKVKKDGKGKKLNLGCGGKSVDGFVNVDIYKSPKIEEVFDMGDIPYLDNTIGAIYSEHALEHVSFERVEEVLKEWNRVLIPGGELILYMPDFELCCQEYLRAPLEHPHFMNTRAWFKYTIYGIQKSQGGEPDEAQFHLSGYSKEEIRVVVERNGFIVDKIENYGGEGQKPSFGTPSMEILARKKEVGKKSISVKKSEKVIEKPKPVMDTGIKIGWIGNENWVAAQSRIRVLRVNDWLNNHGVSSFVTSNFSDIIDRGCDIAIIGKLFNEYIYEGIKKLKNYGKIIYCDLCEDLIGWAYVNEIIGECHKIICCSRVLAEKVKLLNPNVFIIEDAYEIE